MLRKGEKILSKENNILLKKNIDSHKKEQSSWCPPILNIPLAAQESTEVNRFSRESRL